MLHRTSQTGLVTLIASIPTRHPCRALAQVNMTMRHKRIYPERDTRACVNAWCGLFVGSLFVPLGFRHINHGGRISPNGTGTEVQNAHEHENKNCSFQGRSKSRHWRICATFLRGKPQADNRCGDHRKKTEARQKIIGGLVQTPVAFKGAGVCPCLNRKCLICQEYSTHASPTLWKH